MSSFERLVSSRALKSFLSQSVMIIATSFCCYLGEGVLIMVMVISVPDVTWALPALLQQQIDSIVSRAIVGSLCLACLKGCSLTYYESSNYIGVLLTYFSDFRKTPSQSEGEDVTNITLFILFGIQFFKFSIAYIYLNLVGFLYYSSCPFFNISRL